MKILIASDSHGKRYLLERALAMHARADYFIFLGDGLADAEAAVAPYPHMTPIFVSGNCDLFGYGNVPKERVLDLGFLRLFIHHGHTTSVKGGLGSMLSVSLHHDADVCLFGHTHTPYNVYENGTGTSGFDTGGRSIYLFNPGSIGAPSRGAPSFGILETGGGGILLSHGTVNL